MLNSQRYAVCMRRRLVSGLVSAALGMLIVASITSCGGSDGDNANTAASTVSTDFVGSYDVVSDAVVAQGLASTTSTLTALAAAPETATSEAVLEVFEQWGNYEGTIKQNQPDAYLTFEDALGAFKKSAENGDAVGMQAAITDFSTMATQYLADYPG